VGVESYWEGSKAVKARRACYSFQCGQRGGSSGEKERRSYSRGDRLRGKESLRENIEVGLEEGR